MTDRSKLLALAEIDPELVERMANAIRRHVSGYTGSHQGLSMEAEFRAIAGLLPEPVDPDVIEARKIAANFAGISSHWKGITEGKHDDSPAVQCVLSAIRRGRELAQAEALS